MRIKLVCIIGILIFTSYCSRGNIRQYSTKDYSKYLALFKEAYSVVKTRSIEKDINSDALFNGAIEGMFISLGDKHSRYLDSYSLSMLTQKIVGAFGGVGFAFTKRGDYVTILYTQDPSPARKAGINSHDIITAVNGVSTRGIELAKFAKMMLGMPKSKVSLTVLRGSKKLHFILERAIVQHNEIRYGILQGDIAYIKIEHFAVETSQILQGILYDLKKRNINGLIIDLRNNKGGSLVSCIYAANYFLKGVKGIVQIRGRKKIYNKYILTTPRLAIFSHLPIVMLANGKTASAAEIFIAALKDNNRGTFIGSKTYGKGSVQALISFKTISSVGAKLTYAKWYTPNGSIIDGRGLVPDISIKNKTFSKDERYFVFKLLSSDIIYNFVKNNKGQLSKKKIQSFITLVKKKGFKLSDDTLIRLLKKEKYSYSVDLILDMDYDKVLKRAFLYLRQKNNARKNNAPSSVS